VLRNSLSLQHNLAQAGGVLVTIRLRGACMTRRLLVIGLDGVGFDLIAPWVEAGELPCLGRLLAQGTKGPLESTIPPLTGPRVDKLSDRGQPWKTRCLWLDKAQAR